MIFKRAHSKVSKTQQRKMLRSKILIPRLTQNFSVYRASLSSKTTDKILGFHERPNEFEVTADYIGPPDKKSNIRPIVRCIPENETALQVRLRLRRHEVHDWVDKFWRNHNFRFFTEKDEFVQKHKTADQESVPADKMSEFYKAFLDKNWKMHVYFNISWYIKNFELLFLSLQVNLESGVRKIRGKK